MPSTKFCARRRVQRVNDTPLFKTTDYLAVRRAMDELPLIEKLVIEMRFFHNFSISEIARHLRIEWAEADELIESVLPVLRRICLGDSSFSRTTQSMSALLRAA